MPTFLNPIPYLAGAFALSTAFKVFDIIHCITTTHGAITHITEVVVADFAADGCTYLELRTTPKVGRINSLN